MLLFKIYYISRAANHTDKEAAFFNTVQLAAADAFAAAAPDMTWVEWNDAAFIYATAAEVETVLKKSVAAPSVVVFYRNSDREQFKAAYLKGIGNQAAWQKAFFQIFSKAPKSNKGKDDANRDQKGKGSGKGGEYGTGSGNGDGIRECTIVDKWFNQIGLGKVKRLLYGAGAVYTGSNALSSQNKVGQFANGCVSAYLAYLALQKDCSDTSIEGITDLKLTPSVQGIGKVKIKSRFVPVYKEQPVEGLYSGKTNIAFAQNKPGVYIIKENGKTIYIGAGRNVYKCALRHFEPHKGEVYENGHGNKQRYYQHLHRKDYTIRIVLTNTPEQAFKLESGLLTKYKPRDNHYLPELPLTEQPAAVQNIVEEYDQFRVLTPEEIPF